VVPTLLAGAMLTPGDSTDPSASALDTRLLTAPATSLDQQIGDAKTQLTAASKAAEQANRALEQAEDRIRPAEAAVTRAQAKVSEALAAVAAAEQAEATARAALAAAREEVVRQRDRIREVEARIAELIRQISGLARQAYMTGGEQRSLEFLLETDDPADFSLRMEAQRRVSRGNDALFDQATAAREELGRQMAVLRQLEQAAADHEAEAARQADAAEAAAHAAQNARDSAAAAAEQVRRLAEERRNAVGEIEARRREARQLYERLVAQQARASGVTKTTGTLRSGPEAVAWAMNWLGKGSSYDGLCLGFVDDSYAAPGDKRVGTAIGQWYRAKEAGKGHPGDRNPPVGAHVFWWSGNPARHIAIYAGNGMVISTGVDGDRVGMRSMDYMDSYGPYVGWSEPYYG